MSEPISDDLQQQLDEALVGGRAHDALRITDQLAGDGNFRAAREALELAWDALHAHPVEANMGFGDTNFTQGGVALFRRSPGGASALDRALNDGREGFYGWMGLGGSIFQWHPEHEIGFGYVPTSLYVLDFLNERAKAYQAEVLRCVR